MLIDARRVSRGTKLRSNVCIIGAGAAGITIARELVGSGISVLLIESGGFEPDQRVQSLYEGPSRGTILNSSGPYLTKTRLRQFGGTTNHWAGWCRPLDAIDFEARPWVEHSGWPLTRTQLDPYYDRAASILNIAPFDHDVDNPAATRLLASAEKDVIETRLFHFSPPTRFGSVFRKTLVDSPSTTVTLRANAVNLRTNGTASQLSGVDIASLSGNHFSVEADHYVLATGGIENARLLLHSDGVQRGGLGNQYDLVGRFFSDHAHLDAGHAVVSDSTRSMGLYRFHNHGQPLRRVLGVLSLSPAVQREERLLNARVYLRPLGERMLTDLSRAVGNTATGVDHLRDAPQAAGGSAVPRFFALDVSCEAPPNADSRVRLIDEVDELGMRRVELNWQISPAAHRSLRRSMEFIGGELGRKSQGRVQVFVNQQTPWPSAWPGNHNSGTTRMHTDPKHGVVDPNCRVHGISNLFVAGSSTFPTYGFANPTFTIVALAVRLADHLKGLAR